MAASAVPQVLPVSRLVTASVNLSPLAAQTRNFGTLLVISDSQNPSVSQSHRIFTYGSFQEVLDDIGDPDDPVVKAAGLYFGQSPVPRTMMVGLWAKTALPARLIGGQLTTSEQAIGNFNTITNANITISINGNPQTTGPLDWTGFTTLAQVAASIQGALTGVTVNFTGSKRFLITTTASGATDTLSYVTFPGTGTDVSAQLKLTAATAFQLNQGLDAESPAHVVTTMIGLSNAWYGCMFAPLSNYLIPAADDVQVAAIIEAADPTRLFGVSTYDGNVLDPNSTTDVAYLLSAGNYKRSFVQYSTDANVGLFVVASFFGRAFSVNFAAANSTINLMFKQEPGVIAESLGTNDANTLQTKRANVFVKYANNTSIIQYGTMAGPAYFDEIQNLDWFSDALQEAAYNLLYLSPTKIPQTDAGENQIVTALQNVCSQAVTNGMIGPGVWNGPSIGSLNSGDTLKSGFYIFAQPLALQSQSDRDARKAPPITICIKLAGAFNTIDLIIDVNR